MDPRTLIYCDSKYPDVFSGVVSGNQIWLPDLYDVESIHQEAREQFRKLLDRASSPKINDAGKTLLILGQGGSGKTHLLRSFWATTHEQGDGFCGYLQLATKTNHYARYLLSKLIESLEHPYRDGKGETGLKRLAKGVLDAIDNCTTDLKDQLVNDLLEPKEVEELVYRIAYLAVQLEHFQGIDINVIRAILFTLANDTRIHSVILQWLRAEDLSPRDRELLGGLVPRNQPEMAIKTIQDLGRLMSAGCGAAFVLLVDEMEATYDDTLPETERGHTFRSAVNTIVEIADSVPNCIIVMGCIQQLFEQMKSKMAQTKLDRLLHDPPPILLEAGLTVPQIEEVVRIRLNALYTSAGINAELANTIFPFTIEDFRKLDRMRTRDILQAFQKHRTKCIQAGTLLPFDIVDPPPPPPPPLVDWESFLSSFLSKVPDDEPQLAELIRFALSHIAGEHPGINIDAVRDDRFVNLKLTAGKTNRQDLIAICNRNTKGGGLGNQVREVASRAGNQPAILIRSTDFPKDPRQVVTKEIAKLIAPIGKGKRIVVSDSDWRTLAAFQAFLANHGNSAKFSEWQRAEQPLSSLPSIRSILALDELLKDPIGPMLPPVVPPVVPPPPPVVPPVVPPPPPPVSGNSKIQLGVTRGTLPTAVEMNINDYCRHAGFLGGPGSGKTTAALLVIEQLLMAGVAAILIDRKGDLCRYADPSSWSENSQTNTEQLLALRDKIEAVVYTPGIDSGRPLRIPVVPDLAGLTSVERELLAQNAAASLSQMLGYNQKGADPKLVILQKAIELLGRSGNTPVTVKAVQRLIADMDESLANELEGFDAKHFNKLGQDLLVLSISQRRLLEGGEEINVDSLLGRDTRATTGRTRLSIINTQFLGDDKTVDFWLAQFLLCVDRWRSKSPSDSLQAVLFFDEADKYLPATGVVRPATKLPMEGLLKRARSAGLGIFLATQSPGDLDYRCRDQVLNWFIGRVKEARAIEKLKPMFEKKPDAADKLADQTAGEFYLVRESALSAIKVTRNLLETKQLPENRILELSQG